MTVTACEVGTDSVRSNVAGVVPESPSTTNASAIAIAGVGSSMPHHVPQRLSSRAGPTAVSAYSWIVHIFLSSVGSTTVAL